MRGSPRRWTAEALDARRAAGERVPGGRRRRARSPSTARRSACASSTSASGCPTSWLRAARRRRSGGCSALAIPPARGSSTSSRSPTASAHALIEDPLNSRGVSHPFGANSVCEAPATPAGVGASTPTTCRVDVARTSALASAALGRPATTSVYSPVGYSATGRSAIRSSSSTTDPTTCATPTPATVLDNLVHGGVLPPVVVAFVHPGERLVEYADDARHARYLTGELVPQLEARLPCRRPSRPSAASSARASVPSPRCRRPPPRPDVFGRLLLQSGSFAGAGDRMLAAPGAAVATRSSGSSPAFLADPEAVAERVYVTCGAYESLICENRGLVPVLASTGMDVASTRRSTATLGELAGQPRGRHCPGCCTVNE